jgi:hypothetical protein
VKAAITGIHTLADYSAGLKTANTPLKEGVPSANVSMLGPISAAYVILSFHYARSLVQCLGGGHREP